MTVENFKPLPLIQHVVSFTINKIPKYKTNSITILKNYVTLIIYISQSLLDSTIKNHISTVFGQVQIIPTIVCPQQKDYNSHCQ